MMSNNSTETIFNTSTPCVYRRQFKSTNEILLGWDKFNARAFLSLLCLFCIWCITFFITYKPDVSNEGHEGHEGHGGHEGHEGHNMSMSM